MRNINPHQTIHTLIYNFHSDLLILRPYQMKIVILQKVNGNMDVIQDDDCMMCTFIV